MSKNKERKDTYKVQSLAKLAQTPSIRSVREEEEIFSFISLWLPFMCRCDHDKNQLFIDDVYFFLQKCKSSTWFPLGLYRS